MKKVMMLLLLVAAIATVSPAISSEHSYIAGKPDVNDFTINWTDDRSYANISAEIYDSRGHSYGAQYYVRAALDEARSEVPLFIQIYWHPNMERPDTVTLESFLDVDEKWISDRSDLKIQDKQALLLTYKEKKEYMGTEKEPEITPAYYEACYFVENYTEVIVSGELSDWSLDDFRSMMNSLQITPPSGYY